MNDGLILVVAAPDCVNLTGRESTHWGDAAPPLAWQFRPRAAVEGDEAWLQIIPYVVLRDAQGAVWAYARQGGDGRLLGRHSIGVGGHIEVSDRRPTLLDTARVCARRELAEELAQPEAARLNPQPRGWIHERETAIGRVHLGLVFAARWIAPEPPQPKPGEPLAALGFLPPAAVQADDRFERWSQLAVRLLAAED